MTTRLTAAIARPGFVIERILLGIVCVLGLFPPARAQITLDQSDTFEASTTDNWANGGSLGSPPLVVAAGGPVGSSDHFLEITSDGSGAGGKLTAFNHTQWTGDYNTAGVTEIDMDLKGLSSPGNETLSIRISMKSGTLSTSPGYVSSTPFSLPIDGQWHHATFSLADLTPVGSPPPLSSLLDNAPELRIIQAAAANTVHGDNIAAQIGVDNITAVPEPHSTAVVAVLLAMFVGLRPAALIVAGGFRDGRA